MLSLKNLTIFVDKKKIIENLDFNFERGKIYALMGPNGSGKSTLALAIVGHPGYRVSRNSKIIFEKKPIKNLAPEKRAELGLFLSFQHPFSLSGVNIFQLLRKALEGKIDPGLLYQQTRKLAKLLKIKEELLERSLNEGFSGGEKKKMEVLQASLLNPKFLIFDEIDTGVDVDSLRLMAGFLKKFRKQKKTILLITHYNRILKYTKPDRVLVIKDGQLAKVGNFKLAQLIEKYGYRKI